MTRVKALYRSWAIPCSGKQVYGVRHRSLWLDKIGEAGVRRRSDSVTDFLKAPEHLISLLF
jgi:hypothetical protein